MVEGHQCHRVAAAHRRLMVGRAFIARSPNGRFKEGAAAINAKPLQRIEVHGKNLFYFFAPAPVNIPVAPTGDTGRRARTRPHPSPSPSSSDSGDGDSGDEGRAGAAAGGIPGDAAADGGGGGVVVMHVHFGMSGAFRTMALPGPPPTETTRLELINMEMGLVAHLSAMKVNHGSLALYAAKAAQLGPDPLREDADKELLWSRVTKLRKPIGLVLMDQSLVAGVGNIYRAEILFKAGVHPELPACDLDREEFDRIWYYCVDLLQRGFVSGSIITVDPEEARTLGRPWTRRYIYNQKTCGRCKGPVRTWDMAARTVYCCETCQPLRRQQQQQNEGQRGEGGKKGEPGAAGGSGSGGDGSGGGTALSPARLAAMAAARPARLFRSHCAPDEPEDAEAVPAKLTVKQLKTRLTALNLDTRGTKPQLVARLEVAIRWQQGGQGEGQGQGGQLGSGVAQQAGPTTPGAVAASELGGVAEAAGAAGAVEVTGAPVKRRRGLRQLGKEEEGVQVLEEEEEVAVVVEAGACDGAGAGGSGKEGRQSGSGSDGDGGDGDSATSLDRAEQVLTDSMAADTPGPPASLHLELPRLTVVQLRGRLRELGLPTSGTKPTLLQRLTEATTAAAAAAAEPPPPPPASPSSPRAPAAAAGAAATAATAATMATSDPTRPRKTARSAAAAAAAGMSPPGAVGGAAAAAAAAALGGLGDGDTDADAAGTPAAAASGRGGGSGGGGRGMYDIQPGIRGLEARMASARDAAFEKLLAGESRAVEHVALEDDEVVDLLAEQPTPRARKRARSLAAALEAAAAEAEAVEVEIAEVAEDEEEEADEAEDAEGGEGSGGGRGRKRGRTVGAGAVASRAATRRGRAVRATGAAGAGGGGPAAAGRRRARRS